jgi:hypothetical protein
MLHACVQPQYPGSIFGHNHSQAEAMLLFTVLTEYGTPAEIDAILVMLRTRAAEMLQRPRPSDDNALGLAAE